MAVDRQCTYSPSDPAGVALAGSVAGDPVTNPIEPAEFFEADVDDLVGSGALVATDRLGRLDGCWKGSAFPDRR